MKVLTVIQGPGWSDVVLELGGHITEMRLRKIEEEQV
jgi:hypothetical protein